MNEVERLQAEIKWLRAELKRARQIFTYEPPDDCTCASQCLHTGCCLGECSLETLDPLDTWEEKTG